MIHLKISEVREAVESAFDNPNLYVGAIDLIIDKIVYQSDKQGRGDTDCDACKSESFVVQNGLIQ